MADYTCPYCKQTVPFRPLDMAPHQHNRTPGAVVPECMEKKDTIGWAVFTDDIANAALYPLSQERQARDAARRWGACIQAVQLRAGTPDVSSQSDASEESK